MKKELTVLDLFSGIGGFSLGLERVGFSTIAFCEVEPFCKQVLSKHWAGVPIADDIKNLSYKNGKLYDAGRFIYEGKIDLICGGFPCQPFSIAGQQKGTSDHRDLWSEMFRIIQEVKPTWVIGENVANFINMAFTRTKIDLEGEGYRLQPFIIPACAVGAPHRRDRVWIIAHNDSKRLEEARTKQQTERCKRNSASANHGGERTQGRMSGPLFGQQAFSWCKDVRRIEDYFNRPDIPKPLICRSDNGFSSRVDRLRALGNAVVPQIPEAIGHAIINSIKG